MINSIIKKEWLKLRFYFLGMLFIIVASLGHFGFNLDFEFSTIEPESMMWYKFAHLEDKPYFYLSYLFLSLGSFVSVAQFLPERIQDRIKIMAHLPLNMRDSLFYHLFIGIGFVSFLCAILAISLLLILVQYYPDIIIQTAFKDTVAYSFASVVLYVGLSSVIIEKKPIVVFIKFIIITLFVIAFLKNQFTIEDTIWLLFLAFIPFVALDSFYSIKQQRLSSIFFKASGVFVILALFYGGYIDYKENYKKEFNKYYMFYSNIAKDFVYQKNFGDHQFEYGIKDKKTFDRTTYESYLPFVYWRNLDIQGKLPLNIDGVKFDKKTIKNSRLGFSYNPNMLKKLEVELYPLLNPQKNKGMIKFPEEMFSITNKGAFIYDYDNGIVDTLTAQLNTKLETNDFIYPALHIWGKPTNMKPYDKGYLVLDSKNQLFNIKRKNNQIEVNKVNYPENLDLAYIKISENKQKLLSGYAIDKNSNFYFLTWDFEFIKLPLPEFDYKSMKLKLISNPLNYLLRYDDDEDYFAVVFTKKDIKYSNQKLEKTRSIKLH
ncbi:MAG: DUF4857 domain-containing protein [Sulfurovum sp.]|nr:MAG: DUF4857 domain-containing protein [Sulfurovum sp.]